MKKQCEYEIRLLRLDNRSEYFSKQFDELIKQGGIGRQTSISQQNKDVEITNCSIVDMQRNLLYFKTLGYEYQVEDMVNVVYTKKQVL